MKACVLKCRPSAGLLLALWASVAASPALAAAPSSDSRDVVRDTHNQIIGNTYGNCVRTKWTEGKDPCMVAPKQMTQARTNISQEERTIYFHFDKANLTPEAKNKLNTLSRTLKSDSQVKEAKIVGFADRIGTPSYNERLSQRRAETVRNYMTGQGFLNARVTETRWLGESVPKTNCPDSLTRAELINCLQRDRRVEVEIDYLPVKQGL